MPAVTRRHDAGGTVHVHPHVAGLGQQRLARVDPHPNSESCLFERLLGRCRCRNRVGGSLERDEERVALSVHLDAPARLERRPHQAVMLGEQLGVPVAQLVKQPRRALDVREEKGDGAGRQLLHPVRMLVRSRDF